MADPFDPVATFDPDGSNELMFWENEFSPRHPLGPFNPDAPFGFRFIKMIDGTAATYGLRSSMISRHNRQKMFTGDVLAPHADGYMSVARPPEEREPREEIGPGVWLEEQGGGRGVPAERSGSIPGDGDRPERRRRPFVGGIAHSFEWVSFAESMTVRKRWWPGNGDAIGDITVYMYSNPGSLFEVQVRRGPVNQGDVGKFADFSIGRGGIMIGSGNQSSFTLDDRTISAENTSLPFRIYQLPIYGPQTPFVRLSGYNPRHRFNRVWVQLAHLSLPA